MVWQLTKSVLERWIEKLLHIHDTPERTAAAFSLGVFLGFSPFLGLHTAIGLALAFALNLNRVAVLIGVYLHLPWFFGPYYAAGTALGAWLTGARLPADLLPRLQAIRQLDGWPVRFEALGNLIRPLLPSYLIGSTILALILAAVAYWGSLAFIRARRRTHPHHPELP
jgi:uncharacterized protein (DUF2062 family)